MPKTLQIRASQLVVGAFYTYGNSPEKLIYDGECDISDQYHFAKADKPELIYLTLEVRDLKHLTPVV